MENTKTCETCKHFIQHYYKFGQTFRPLSVGRTPAAGTRRWRPPPATAIS